MKRRYATPGNLSLFDQRAGEHPQRPGTARLYNQPVGFAAKTGCWVEHLPVSGKDRDDPAALEQAAHLCYALTICTPRVASAGFASSSGVVRCMIRPVDIPIRASALKTLPGCAPLMMSAGLFGADGSRAALDVPDPVGASGHAKRHQSPARLGAD